MKKTLLIKLIFATSILISQLSLSSCNKSNSASEKAAKQNKITVLSTTFPSYDWVRQIIGEDSSINNELLIKNGVDLHSFQPSTTDIIKISSSDILIYIGGESDKWIEDVLKSPSAKNVKTINLIETLGTSVFQEEIVEGMEAKEECQSDDEIEYDEHVWLSLKNAKKISWKITEALCQVNNEKADLYKNNMKTFESKLNELNFEYEQAVKNSKGYVIFADRFPFRYLTEDYNLNYYAAFAGCSAETEASFETIAFLSNKLNELNLNAIFTIETSDQKIAKTIITNSKNQATKLEVMDSMQNTTLKQALDGKTYIETMKKNLEALKKGL